MSRLALGTVQFGLDYGITNQNGQVAMGEIKSILDTAKNNRINTLDTAASYGNSEEVLGRAGIDNFQVITKTIPIKNGVNAVVREFHQSLKKLKQRKVNGLLVHDIKEIEHKQFDLLFKKLTELKQQGLVNKIGFSTYEPKQVDFLLKNFDFDLIQVPFNVFDTRLIDGGQLQALKNQNIEIHARSVFLQGLLLDFEHLSDYFSTWKDQFNEYQIMTRESELTLLEYALNFVLDVQEIDKVLVGVNNEQQLKKIIKSIKGQNGLNAYFIDDVNLLNPSLWKV